MNTPLTSTYRFRFNLKWLLSCAIVCGLALGGVLRGERAEEPPAPRPQGQRPRLLELVAKDVPPVGPVQKWKNRGRGHKTSPMLAQFKAESHRKFAERLKALPKVTAATYDIVPLGLAPIILDQGQCGSCWDFSGCEVATSAFLKAGYGSVFKNDTFSPQYVLDCGQNGGCNGDDNITVLAMCKATGLVTTTDYGAYQGSAGRCKPTTGMTVYKIADWGFCTTSNTGGVATVQDIKNAMVAYGAIGSGVDASQFDSYTGGVLSGSGSSIDHDILLVGWDDTKGTAGAWKLQNSWGTSWGLSGYMWIEYGAYSVGTEACWATATALPPVPTPTPPPGPVPPVPPVPPGPAPVGTTNITITGPIVPNGSVTGEFLPTGTASAIQSLVAISQPVVPAPTPLPPTTVEARLDALEAGRVADSATLKKISDQVSQLSQLIGGKK